MSFIKSTIEIEEQRIKALVSSYEEQLLLLPKGSLTAKKRGNKVYFYLSYRRKSKVVTDYIGTDMMKIKETRQKLEWRKHAENMIKAFQKELILINRLKGNL